MDARTAARALGGQVIRRNVVLAPGPQHSRQDRSLCVKLDATAPEGFLCHSYCGDDWRDCRAHVREKLGLPQWQPDKRQGHVALAYEATESPPPSDPGDDERAGMAIARARLVWDQGRDPRGTLAETYLTKYRKLDLPEALCGSVLRFTARCPWHDEATGRAYYVPALLAPFRSTDNDSESSAFALTLTGANTPAACLASCATVP
jgi:putative DNA primase/helicase